MKKQIKTKIYQTLQSQVDKVETSFPNSFWSKDEVLELLKRFAYDLSADLSELRSEKSFLSRETIDSILYSFKESVKELDFDDCVKHDSAEFSLNYNEISLDFVKVSASEISELVAESLEEHLEELATIKDSDQADIIELESAENN